MAKKIINTDKLNLKDAIKKMEEKHGDGIVMRLDSDKKINVEVIPTGSINLDSALGVGGIAKGRIIEIYGPESCLAKDTFIQFVGRNVNGEPVTHHGGTIQQLYNKFYSIETTDGRTNRWKGLSSIVTYTLPSIDENENVFQNKILSIVKTGLKKCIRIKTSRGANIEATAEHKFYTGMGIYLPLSQLKVGDVIYLHENTRKHRTTKKILKEYEYIRVKYHPTSFRIGTYFKKYTYTKYAIKKCNAVIEASKNNMSFDEYINFLNTATIAKIDILWTIPKRSVCHHIDGDSMNDAIENLQLLTIHEHSVLHARKNKQYMNFIVTTDIIIDKEEVGERDTYDIECLSPYNNYIANKFVVHNSAKTTLALHIISNAQKMKMICAFIDAEHALDVDYARKLGVDTKDMYIAQPSSGEQALDIVEEFVKTGEVGLIVIDSVAALTPLAEINGEMGASHMGLQARLMSQALRKLTAITSKAKCTIIFINQIRTSIGQTWGSGEFTPGGKALKFYTSMRIEVRRANRLTRGEEIVGSRIAVKIAKNKLASPFKTTSFDVLFGEGISKVNDLLEFATLKGIVKKEGISFFFDNEKIGVGLDKTRAVLTDNIELFKKIEIACRKLI